MRANRLWHAAGVAGVLFLGLNAVVFLAARHTQRQRLLAALDRIPLSTRCLFLGNSLVEAGCDPEAFDTAWTPPISAQVAANVALGATSPVEHYLILRRAFRRPLQPKYVVYGFFDDQLVAPSRGDWSELVGNRALSYYFPAEAARFYAPGSWLAAWRLALLGRIPVVAERSSLWEMVERLRRRLDCIGLPRPKTNRYGRVSDFQALEPSVAADFARRCQSIVQRRLGFSPQIKSLIQLARERGAEVILVEMPMSPRHRREFYALPQWRALQTHLAALAQQEQATYLAASDWVAGQENFEDDVHLNPQGARLFSARLAETLCRGRDVAASPHAYAGAFLSGGTQRPVSAR